MKVCMNMKVFSLALMVAATTFSLLATQVFATTTPGINISVGKNNLPRSITIKVRITQFKADAYLTVPVQINVAHGGGPTFQSITVTRSGTGSVTVSCPEDFVGGQHFPGFSEGTCTVYVWVWASWGLVHANTTFKVN